MNQSGQASAEFLFSMVIAFGLFILFLGISLTFTVTEVGQYIAFSVARAQVGGNKDQASQRAAALSKYQSFMSQPSLALLFKTGWFVFGKTPDIRQGTGTDFRKELGDGESGPNPQFKQVFTGVSIPFESKVLSVQIPFLNPDGNGEDSGFKSHINAILIRDVSMAECQKYWDQRAQALKQLPSGSNFYDPAAYSRMEDSGC